MVPLPEQEKLVAPNDEAYSSKHWQNDELARVIALSCPKQAHGPKVSGQSCRDSRKSYLFSFAYFLFMTGSGEECRSREV